MVELVRAKVSDTTPPEFLVLGAKKRIQAAIDKHGINSPEVAALALRWAGILSARGIDAREWKGRLV